MPSVSQAQQRMMGAELRRKRQGKKTKTKMSEKQLEEFAHKAQEGVVVKHRDLILEGLNEGDN